MVVPAMTRGAWLRAGGDMLLQDIVCRGVDGVVAQCRGKVVI